MELAVTTIERRKTCRDSTKKKKEATRMSEREPITDRLAGPAAASSRLNYLVLTFSGARVARLVGPGFDQQLGSAKNARRAGVQSSSGVKETDESDGRVNKLRYEPVKERAVSCVDTDTTSRSSTWRSCQH